MTGPGTWTYPDGCKIYGLTSPHGCVVRDRAPDYDDHEHFTLSEGLCSNCREVVRLDPPARTTNEAIRRVAEHCPD